MGAEIRHRQVSSVPLVRARLRMARLAYVQFDDTDLRQACCDRLRMEGGWFRRCVLREASFRRAELNRVSFYDTDAEESLWHESDLHHVSFNGTKLAGSSFSGVDLMMTRFDFCDISGADFRDAHANSQLLKQTVWRRAQPPLLPAHLDDWLAANRSRFRERVMTGDRWIYDHEEQGWPQRKLLRYPHLDSDGQ